MAISQAVLLSHSYRKEARILFCRSLTPTETQLKARGQEVWWPSGQLSGAQQGCGRTHAALGLGLSQTGPMAVSPLTSAHLFPLKRINFNRRADCEVVSLNSPNQSQKGQHENPTVLPSSREHCPSAIRPSYFLSVWLRCQMTSRSFFLSFSPSPLVPLSILGALLFLESLDHPYFSHYRLTLPLICSIASDKPAFSPSPLQTVLATIAP